MPQRPSYVTDSGVFLAFEGGEGAGKSTQTAKLVARLRDRGLDPLTTREPGGTAVGQRLRELVLDPATGDLSPRTEALIYAADRAEHVDSLILPALHNGRIVITDRYADSTLAYQGAGRSLDSGDLAELIYLATGGLQPHLTILLDVDPADGMARLKGRDRIEAEPLAFHQRVREAFRRLAQADPDRYLVLDGRRPADDIHAEIMERLEPLLGLLS